MGCSQLQCYMFRTRKYSFVYANMEVFNESPHITVYLTSMIV